MTEASTLLFKDLDRDNIDEVLKLQKNLLKEENEESGGSGNSSGGENDLANSFSNEDEKSDGSQKYQSGQSAEQRLSDLEDNAN